MPVLSPENAYEAAKTILAKQNQFKLSDEQWEAFCKALDRPPQVIPALQTLMTEPGVFDE